MSRPLVDRYEQILQQDPTSTVFVELAKALILKGDHARAIEVCQQGLTHHASSVVGRVLWGKALIFLGRPAEAMEQFDQAIAIDRENPHAYNLIAEVLLQKGLYRSALPLLRKASALQPNDARVRDWLEKAQTALSGGPAPSADEVTNPGSPLLALADPEAGGGAEGAPAADAEAARLALAASDPFGEAAAPLAGPGALASVAGARVASDGDVPLAGPGARAFAEGAAPLAGPGALAAGATPSGGRAKARGAATPARGAAPAAGPGALAHGAPPDAEMQGDGAAPLAGPGALAHAELPDAPLHGEAPAEGVSGGGAVDGNAGGAAPVAGPGALAAGRSGRGVAPAVTPSRGGLLPELPPLDEASPPRAAVTPPRPARAATAARPPPPASRARSGLLGDLPDFPESTTSVDVPKVELSTTSADEIAQQYEKELRAKLAENAKKESSFLARNAAKVAAATVLVAAIAVGAGAFLWTRAQNRGRDLQDALSEARKAIALDTRQGYGDALAALDSALQMDGRSTEAWALTAQAHALLFSDHGGGADHRARVTEALAKPGVAEAFPAIALTARYYIADSAAREAARKALLSSSLDAAEVQELAGRVLFAQKDLRGAVERFRRAIELSPSNVRALVALGGYYRAAGDHTAALRFFETAKVLSPVHPERVVGAAEARLELRKELPEALAELESLPAGEELAPDLHARRELAHARLLALNGRAEEGVQRLTERAAGLKGRAYEYHLTLGEVSVAAGDYAGAQRAFEAAVKARPGSEEAKEALGRVLLGRDRPRDVLKLSADRDDRKVSLVRAIAHARLDDWKKARAELARTQVNGKYTPEAIVYLALADAAEGDPRSAEEALQSALAASKKSKAELRLALGNLHWSKGALEKARAQFEAAAKEDPLDYEAPCALGRLQLQQRALDKALPALEQAVARNHSHGEARHALGRALLAKGKVAQALENAQAWVLDDPTSASAQAALALAQHLSGKWREADAASARAVKLDGEDAGARRVRAVVLFGIGDARGAFAELERANKLDPRDPETFCEIGHAFLRQGNPAHARAAFGAALREAPGSDCGTIGDALAQLPSNAKALTKVLADRAEKALAAADRAQAYAGLSRAQLAGGAVTSARQSAEKAVETAAYVASGHYALALVAARQKDDAAARAALRKAVDLEPAHTPMRLALADALSKSGELDTAVKEYETYLRLGAAGDDAERVQKALPELRKRLAAR